jgi:hypothetical protein
MATSVGPIRESENRINPSSTVDLKPKVAEILNNAYWNNAQKAYHLANLLSAYTTENLPTPEELGLSQPTWLYIYWAKRETERGKPLSSKEQAWDIPLKSMKGTVINDALTDYVLKEQLPTTEESDCPFYSDCYW